MGNFFWSPFVLPRLRLSSPKGRIKGFEMKLLSFVQRAMAGLTLLGRTSKNHLGGLVLVVLGFGLLVVGCQSPTTPSGIPQKPAGFSAVAGNSQVALSWNTVSGATAYHVAWAGGNGSTVGGTIDISGGAATSYTQTGLANGFTYTYTMYASNSTGNSPATDVLSAKPYTTIAAIPTLTSATAGNGQVSLSWTAVTAATSYNVYRSTSSGSQGTKIASPTTAGYTDVSVTNGTTYYYEVAAVLAGGESQTSNQLSATPLTLVTGVPTGLGATAGNNQVGLTWTGVAGATSYNVYRSTASGIQGSKVASATSASFTDTYVANGTSYFYEVTAVSAAGESGASNQVTSIPVNPPLAPSGLTATAGNSLVALTWTSVSGATSYNVYRSLTLGIQGGVIASPTSANFSDTSVTNGTTYYYEVAAVASAVESRLSSWVSATPPWIDYSTGNGLGSNVVLNVAVSGSSVYAATTGGLSISNNGGTSWTNYTSANGLGGSYVYAVAVSGSTIYAASNGGLSVSTNGGTSWTNHSSANTIYRLVVSGSTIYAATAGGLSVSTNAGSSWTNYTIANGLGNNLVIGEAVSGSSIYAATNGGLSVSTNGGTSWINYTAANGLASSNVTAVAVSGSTIYAATNGGLSVSTNSGTSWTSYTTTNGLGDNQVDDVVLSGSSIYVATAGGLSLSSNGGASWTNYSSSNGLGTNNAQSVAVSGTNIYVATNGGGLSVYQ